MTRLRPSVREAEAMQIECPTCAAPAGAWCLVIGTGKINSYIHIKRLPKR